MILASRNGQAHADLAVGHFACGASVLTLDSDRVLSLLQKASVIDEPGFDGTASRH
jgi:hypothetical protein